MRRGWRRRAKDWVVRLRLGDRATLAMQALVGISPVVRSDRPLYVDVDAMLLEEAEQLGLSRDARSSLADGRALRQHLHSLPPDQRPAALCLSGGGIRSATFSLGVLQGLAGLDKLDRFHYLSTVSGGGYVGSFLSAWIGERGLTKTKANLRSATPAGPGANDPVSRLRAYSNYLSPVTGLSTDAMTLVAIFLRNGLLNLLVWLPLLCVGLMVPRLYLTALDACISYASDSLCLALALIAFAFLLIGLAYIAFDLPPQKAPSKDMDSPASDRFLPFCFLPVLVATILFSLAAAAEPAGSTNSFGLFAAYTVLVNLVAFVIGTRLRQIAQKPARPVDNVALRAATLLAGSLAGALPLWLVWRAGRLLTELEVEARLPYVASAVPMLLVGLWLGMVAHAAVARRASDEDEREWWSRASGTCLRAAAIWLLLCGFVLWLPPLVVNMLSASLPAGLQLGAGGALLGAVASGIGYWSKEGSELFKRTTGFFHATGLRLLDVISALAIGCILLTLCLGVSALLVWLGGNAAQGHFLGWLLGEGAGELSAHVRHLDGAAIAGPPGVADVLADFSVIYGSVLLEGNWQLVVVPAAALLIISLAVSGAIGANAFSLHGLYGNRLVRAYLGAVRDPRSPHPYTGFDPADNRPISSLSSSGPLFHVVNIAMNLVLRSGRRLAWQQRKAASFTATPLRCGSDCTGFVDSSRYGAMHGMTLGRAMTISGAAASPNMGYHSSPWVTMVMTLFNVRLGWWLPNPRLGRERTDMSERLLRQPEPLFGFAALIAEGLGLTTDDRKSIYTSDGGHFDNLGLYEMVRRRCHCIVVIDATADGGYEYADLLDTVRKVQVDFGIRIELPDSLPGQPGAGRFMRTVTGLIHYKDQDGEEAPDGLLHVVKPLLRTLGWRQRSSDPAGLRAYAAMTQGRRGGTFPHQSTTDQFYDETQFESYRQLGWLTAHEALSGNLLEPSQPPDPPPDPPLPATGGPASPEPEKSSGKAGLLSTIEPFALLAAALTLGGTIGVAGTVTLTPSEVSLSAADRDLLGRSRTLELTLSDDLRRDGVRLNATAVALQLEDIRGALHKSSDELLKIRETLSDSSLRQGIQEASRQLEFVANSLDKGRTDSAASTLVAAFPGAGSVGLNQVADRLRAIEKAIEKSLPVPPSRSSSGVGTGGAADLSGVLRSLGEIKKSVDEVGEKVMQLSPRRNVQGPEGARR